MFENREDLKQLVALLYEHFENKGDMRRLAALVYTTAVAPTGGFYNRTAPALAARSLAKEAVEFANTLEQELHRTGPPG